MLNAAKIVNDKVENIIYISESVFSEWTAAGQELIDVEPLGMHIGDYREGGVWYRDLDGQKVQLPVPIDTGPSYEELLSYYTATKEAIEE